MMKEIDVVLQDPAGYRARAFRKEFRSAPDSAGQRKRNPSRGTRIRKYMTPPFRNSVVRLMDRWAKPKILYQCRWNQGAAQFHTSRLGSPQCFLRSPAFHHSLMLYGLMKRLKVPHNVAPPGALIGASNCNRTRHWFPEHTPV